MNYGLQVRLNRICNDSGKMLIVPIDHGITIGAVDGLVNVEQTVAQVLKGGANGIIVHKGLVRRIVPYITDGKVMGIHLNASTNLVTGTRGKSMVCDIEEAVSYGADFVSYHINFGLDYEMIQLRELGTIKKKCEELGLPLLVMTYVKDSKGDVLDGESISHAVRAVEELGADIIKCSLPDNMDAVPRIIGAVKQPVLFSGGEKRKHMNELYVALIKAMRAGASGAIIGRNVFESKNPENVAAVLYGIVEGKIVDAMTLNAKEATYERG